MLTLFVALSMVYGVIIGSALNAFVWRLHEKTSWVRGKSRCERCGHELHARDLVPLLSWLFLRGRCRYCGTPIGLSHPAVELATALLFGLSTWTLHPSGVSEWVSFIVWLWLLIQLIILAVYDLRWMLLPDKVTFPAMAVALAVLIWQILSGQPLQVWLGPLEAAVIFGGIFWVLANVAGGRLMGGGDAKLAILMGLILGVRLTGLALFIAFDTAAIVGIALILARRGGRNSYLPFGPFLIGGTVIAYLWGAPVVDWYLRLNGL